jgi:crotonobetainyl-CoA:carnitine CoA-transferase CaiB-like acyl-CoA transferase
VYCAVSGYGLAGPDRDRPSYDVGAFWARSGLAGTIVPPGQLPPGIRSGMGDHVTGLTLCAGVLAKLLERERTGQGGLVATSLLRAGMYCQGWDLGIVLRFGRIQRTRPRTANPAPLVNCYAASDGKGFWLLGLEQDRHWPGLVSALERPELRDDPRFATAAQRAEHAETLIALLDEAFATRTREDWTVAFDLHDVWWAPINTLQDVLADPQCEAAGGFVDMPLVDGVEPYRAVASPVDFDGFVQRPGPVPELGQHTQEILASLLP